MGKLRTERTRHRFRDDLEEHLPNDFGKKDAFRAAGIHSEQTRRYLVQTQHWMSGKYGVGQLGRSIY